MTAEEFLDKADEAEEVETVTSSANTALVDQIQKLIEAFSVDLTSAQYESEMQTLLPGEEQLVIGENKLHRPTIMYLLGVIQDVLQVSLHDVNSTEVGLKSRVGAVAQMMLGTVEDNDQTRSARQAIELVMGDLISNAGEVFNLNFISLVMALHMLFINNAEYNLSVPKVIDYLNRNENDITRKLVVEDLREKITFLVEHELVTGDEYGEDGQATKAD